MASEIIPFSTSQFQFTGHDRSTHRNPASLEFQNPMQKDRFRSAAFALDDIPKRRIHHGRAITLQRALEIRK